MSTVSFSHVAILILAVAYLAATIWAIVLVARDAKLRDVDKAVWIAALLIVPILALLAWVVVRARRRATGAPQ